MPFISNKYPFPVVIYNFLLIPRKYNRNGSTYLVPGLFLFWMHFLDFSVLIWIIEYVIYISMIVIYYFNNCYLPKIYMTSNWHDLSIINWAMMTSLHSPVRIHTTHPKICEPGCHSILGFWFAGQQIKPSLLTMNYTKLAVEL